MLCDSSQSIQLLSTSVVANVAFGETVQEIDEDKVWEALRAAQLDEIVSEMPWHLFPIRIMDWTFWRPASKLALARSFMTSKTFGFG